MQVFLIRHPPPQVPPGTCYGQLDLPASEAESSSAVLRAQSFAALVHQAGATSASPFFPHGLPVISSPLQRCRALAEALHPAPRLEPGLMEMHFGDWEGRRWDDIDRAELDAWAADLLHYVRPGGESVAQLQARVVASLDRLAAEGIAACVVVTHAGVMRAAVGHCRGLPAAGWTQLRFDYSACVPLSWPATGGQARAGLDGGEMAKIRC